MRTAVLTCLALIAFAANSVLCRLALGDASIDAASFSTIRLAAGAAALALVLAGRGDRPAGSWPSALALFLYAVPFSFAYLSLDVGTGALILFGAVQATMIATGLREGERPHRLEWLGLVIAVGGLVYLTSPGLTAPSPGASLLMGAAGIAWGVYSLRGRSADRPIAVTAGNFLLAVPPALAVSLAFAGGTHLSGRGALLAVVSGAATSGLGYVVWYAALGGLSATRAATAQLAVPVLTALGGVAVLGEPVTLRLVLAAALILGGVALALRGRSSGTSTSPRSAPGSWRFS